jgi:hypothetical protein
MSLAAAQGAGRRTSDTGERNPRHGRLAALALSVVLGAGLSAAWSPRTPAAPSGALKARAKAR